MEKWFNRQLASGLPYLEHSEPYGGGATATASSAQRTATTEEPHSTHQGAVRGNKRSHIYQ
jgi:hypothetical protein